MIGERIVLHGYSILSCEQKNGWETGVKPISSKENQEIRFEINVSDDREQKHNAGLNGEIVMLGNQFKLILLGTGNSRLPV